MKKHSVVLILLLISGRLYSQPTGGPPSNYFQETKSSFYIEFGGNAVFTSINYDLTFNSDYGVRIGASPGLFLISDLNGEQSEEYNFDLTGLISAFKLFGSDSHKFETGAGAVFGESITPRDDNYPAIPALSLNFGYRFITPREKGLSLRAMLTPTISKNGLIPWLGVSIGFSFTNKVK